MSEPKPYRPSNGFEGEIFYHNWCAKCTMDDPPNHKMCPIYGASLIYKTTDSEYPPQWVETEDGPECTAFCDNHPPTEADRQYMEWKAST